MASKNTTNGKASAAVQPPATPLGNDSLLRHQPGETVLDTGRFVPIAQLGVLRLLHTASAISNSRVLVVGGKNSAQSVADVEIYDARDGLWRGGASLHHARSSHTATVLPGRQEVLVIGGMSQDGDSIASVELYEVDRDIWRFGTPMPVPRENHTATLLHSGEVLITGGRYFKSGVGTVLQDVLIYNPALDQWRQIPSLTHARFSHTATLMPDATVVVIGGISGNAVVREVEVLDAHQAGWTSRASLPDARAFHSATPIADGGILLAGGSILGASIRLQETYIYREGMDDWEVGAWMHVAVGSPSATLLDSGKVLLIGGIGAENSPRVGQLFDPVTKNWASTYPQEMEYPIIYHTATLLDNGDVLIVAGSDPRLPHINPIHWTCLYMPVHA